MSKEPKTAPLLYSVGMGMGLRGYLPPSSLSSDAQEIVKALHNNILTIEGSDDCIRYKSEETHIIDQTFSPIKQENLLVNHAYQYNIHGYQLAFKALQEISKASEIPNMDLYGQWKDSDIFSEIFYRDPEEANEKIKIVYGIYDNKFSFTVPNIENVAYDYNFYETYSYNSLSEAIEKKEKFYDALHSLYNERIMSSMRRMSALNNFLLLVQEHKIKAYASLTAIENNNFPDYLEGKKVEIPYEQWQMTHPRIDNRILRIINNQPHLGIIQVPYEGKYYNGITIFKNEDVEKLIALARQKKNIPEHNSLDNSQSSLSEDDISQDEQIEKCRHFIIHIAEEQKHDGKRPIIDNLIYTKKKLKSFCHDKYPKVLTARFNEIWTDATKICPHWADSGRGRKSN